MSGVRQLLGANYIYSKVFTKSGRRAYTLHSIYGAGESGIYVQVPGSRTYKINIKKNVQENRTVFEFSTLKSF
jgi:hypothetical protein